jgi:DNA transposition AAA+ family ATPase
MQDYTKRAEKSHQELVEVLELIRDEQAITDLLRRKQTYVDQICLRKLRKLLRLRRATYKSNLT